MPDKSSNNSTDRYWQGLSWILFFIGFRVVIGIGSSIIFVRYLGDKGYGSVVVMADFVTLSIVILSMGMGVVQTRVLPQLFVQDEYGKAKDFIFKTTYIRIGLSLLATIVLYPCIPVLLDHVYAGIPEGLLKIALVLIPIQMVVFCLRGTLEVTFHQKDVSIGSISALVVRLGCAVPVILLDLGILWFFFTQLVADLYLLLTYARVFYKRVWPKLKHVKREKNMGEFYSLGLIMMLTLLCNRFLGKEMDTQILSFRLHEAGLAEVAIYSISFMLVLRSLSFIGVGSGSMANLSQSMLSELVQTNNLNAIREIYRCQIQLFYLIAIPLVAGSFLFAEPLIVLMFGGHFAGSGKVCAVLFLGIGGTIINYLNSPMLYAFGKEKKLLICRAFFGGLNVVLSMIFAFKGAFGVASATGFCLMGIAVYETFVVRKLVTPKFPWTFFVKTIAGSLLMVVCSSGFFNFYPDDTEKIRVLLGIVMGILSFGVAMILLKPLDRQVVANFSGLPKAMQMLMVRFVR